MASMSRKGRARAILLHFDGKLEHGGFNGVEMTVELM